MDTWNELGGSQSRFQQRNAPTPAHDTQSFQESKEYWSEP